MILSYRLPKVPPKIKANAVLNQACCALILNCQITIKELTAIAILLNNHPCQPLASFKKPKADPALKVKNKLNIGKTLTGSLNGKHCNTSILVMRSNANIEIATKIQ